MSGVYIKDMEMPTSCYYCPFMDGSWGYSPPHKARCVITGKDMPVDERGVQHNQSCPLVPVPTHVRPVVLCSDCVYSNKWYADRLICYLWNEHDGNAVFEDGFCNYGLKREES